MTEITSIAGPVDRVDNRFVLQIPLQDGGAALAPAALGIGTVAGDMLVVHIPDWLAEMLKLEDGSLVQVDNREGKFNIHLVPA
jgi:hypothetical protein